ncbi:MAG TPA: Yip1 family protein, partial [Burkholderiaceae bacterium]|nr:Yip1 family protein [Burkholderiaceae bacterium]
MLRPALFQRVQEILLRPRNTWPVIEREPGSIGALYRHYVLVLAAIPAVAGFIGLSVVGAGALGFHVRVSLGSGLVHMVVGYALSLAVLFGLALLVEALAPTFGGVKDRQQAFKLVAYSATASFVGGLFSLMPALAILGVLASLYTIYLIYTGLPVLMKVPRERALAYTATIVVCGVIASVMLAMLSAATLPSRMSGMAMSDVDIKLPGGRVSIDTAKMEQAAKRIEEAGKRMESAQSSGDPAAAGKAVSEVLGAVVGMAGKPVAMQALKDLLPASLGEFHRESLEAHGTEIGMSSAKASYAAGERQIELAIADLGVVSAVAAVWGQFTGERETAEEVETTY